MPGSRSGNAARESLRCPLMGWVLGAIHTQLDWGLAPCPGPGPPISACQGVIQPSEIQRGADSAAKHWTHCSLSQTSVPAPAQMSVCCFPPPSSLTVLGSQCASLAGTPCHGQLGCASPSVVAGSEPHSPTVGVEGQEHKEVMSIHSPSSKEGAPFVPPWV